MMVAKAELEEIREILNPPADESQEANDTEVEEEQTTEETVDEQVEDEVVEETEEVVEATDDAGDEVKSYTPEKLAEAIGWETSDVYNDIVIPMKDGENVPLGEFKNKYQDLAHDNEKLQTQLTEAQTGLEQAQSGVTQTQQLSQDMIAQMGYLENINRVEANTDWEELESLDTTDALLQRDKIRRARDEVNNNIALLQQKEKEANKVYLQQSYSKMLDIIPEWKDGKVMEKDQSEMRAVMRDYGFDDSETNSIADPRQMKLLRRLSYLENKDKKAAAAVKKVRAAPKTLKGRKVEPVTSQEKIDGLVSKARQSGSKKDEFNAVKALLAQGQ